jgi:hypothetical protein
VDGRRLRPRHDVRLCPGDPGDLFWSLFGGMGLFTPTGLTYLLPWPLLAVAITAFVCFYIWPKPPAGART